MDRYLSLNVGVNPLDGLRQIDVYGRTEDGRPHHDSSSAAAQSRTKNLNPDQVPRKASFLICIV